MYSKRIQIHGIRHPGPEYAGPATTTMLINMDINSVMSFIAYEAVDSWKRSGEQAGEHKISHRLG